MAKNYLTLNEILEAIETYDNIKKKAIASLIFTSSMKASKICELTIKDFIKACNQNNIASVLELDPYSIIPQWKDKNQLTFNSPITTEYIIKYLKQESKKQELKEEWPLFYSSRGTNGYFTKKSIEQIISSHEGDNFKQKKLLEYFKFVFEYNLPNEDDLNKKQVIDLLMGNTYSDNPFIKKSETLKKYYESVLPEFGYDNQKFNENQDETDIDVKTIVKEYFQNYFLPTVKDYDFQERFEMRREAYELAEKDFEKGKFKNNRDYLERLCKKGKIFVMVWKTSYYTYALHYPNSPLGSVYGEKSDVYGIMVDIGLKEELGISEEKLRKEIIGARSVKNLPNLLNYKNLMTIFDCILYNIVDGIYLSDGLDD